MRIKFFLLIALLFTLTACAQKTYTNIDTAKNSSTSYNQDYNYCQSVAESEAVVFRAPTAEECETCSGLDASLANLGRERAITDKKLYNAVFQKCMLERGWREEN